MAKQVVIYAIMVLVGLAGGIGLRYWMAGSKIMSAKATIDQLQTDQAQTQDKLNTALTDIAKLKSDLSRSRNDAMRLNTELTRTKKELGRNQAVLKQALGQQQPSTPQTRAATTASKTSAQLPAGVREYTIKDGDSFWKIAASELGYGARYKEIEALNPEVAAAKNLVIGTKIKIPAK